MEKINIVVTSATGASREYGSLLPSGIIKYSNGKISHIAAEINSGKSIMEYEQEIVNKPIEKLEDAPIVRTKTPKKKK